MSSAAVVIGALRVNILALPGLNSVSCGIQTRLHCLQSFIMYHSLVMTEILLKGMHPSKSNIPLAAPASLYELGVLNLSVLSLGLICGILWSYLVEEIRECRKKHQPSTGDHKLPHV